MGSVATVWSLGEKGAGLGCGVPNAPLQSYKDLVAWQRAMSLVDAVLPMCVKLRRTRRAIASQLERAVISVAANIAEGYGRPSRAEYLRFLSFAAASLREVETYLLIVQRNSLLPREDSASALVLADETGRVLHGLRRGLRASSKPQGSWPT